MNQTGELEIQRRMDHLDLESVPNWAVVTQSGGFVFQFKLDHTPFKSAQLPSYSDITGQRVLMAVSTKFQLVDIDPHVHHDGKHG